MHPILEWEKTFPTTKITLRKYKYILFFNLKI